MYLFIGNSYKRCWVPKTRLLRPFYLLLSFEQHILEAITYLLLRVFYLKITILCICELFFILGKPEYWWQYFLGVSSTYSRKQIQYTVRVSQNYANPKALYILCDTQAECSQSKMASKRHRKYVLPPKQTLSTIKEELLFNRFFEECFGKFRFHLQFITMTFGR